MSARDGKWLHNTITGGSGRGLFVVLVLVSFVVLAVVFA